MKKFVLPGIWILSLVTILPIFGMSPDAIIYRFPKDNAKWITPEATIILKFNQPVVSDQIQFDVIGTKSGIHAGDKILSRDRRTLIFKPQITFALGESVQVTVSDDRRPDRFRYEFSTAETVLDQTEMFRMHSHDSQTDLSPGRTVDSATTINGVSVPSDFPEIRAHRYGETAPGRIFLNTWHTSVGRYLIICENDGTPYFYRHYNTALADFKMHPSGVLSAFTMNPRCFMVLDDHYNQINTYRAGHGYWTDPHDLVLLPNGHALIIAFEWIDVDMSQLVQGGDPQAQVLGNHVQEVDSEGHVFFEFRCWDHYRIQDTPYKNLTSRSIDYTHTNSVAVDYDSHYVISVRHFNEITKVNRFTEEILWRLGGPYNQFEFINDFFKLDYQHHARPVPGKPNHYTIFDNGNHRDPAFSRAVEFRLDTVAMTAEKVWEFRHPEELFASGMGSAQRLPNGNTFIDWGRGPPASIACEVDSTGNILYETERLGISSYRSKRFEWEGMPDAPYLIAESHNDRIILIFNKFGDQNVNFYRIFSDTHEEPTTLLMTAEETLVHLTDLENNTTRYFRVTAVDSNGQQSAFSNTEEVEVQFVSPGQNLILNGNFSGGATFWTEQTSDQAEGRGTVTSGQYRMQIQNGGTDYSHIQILQDNIELVQGETYCFEFDARSDSIRIIEAKLTNRLDPLDNYSRTPLSLIHPQMMHFVYHFQMDDPGDYNARAVFNCGGSDSDVYLDNVSLRQVQNSDVEPPLQVVPQNAALHPNYPNPFNGSTQIRFDLPEQERVSLKIYDLLGREMAAPFNGIKQTGSHTILFQAADFPSGVYLLRMETPTMTQIRKMILMK